MIIRLRMIIQKIECFGKKLFLEENSIQKLTLSTCLGIFVAFSPFVFLHTVLAISLSWLLSFNMGVTLAVSAFIYNPLTMALICALDYAFGYMLCLLCRFDSLSCAPAFLMPWCDFLSSYVGLPSNSIWTFFVGGNILSIGLAIIMYWPVKWCFEAYRRGQYE